MKISTQKLKISEAEVNSLLCKQTETFHGSFKVLIHDWQKEEMKGRAISA